MGSIDGHFAWEKATHEAFFLPFYERHGFTVTEDHVGTKTDWDVLLERDGQRYRVDEKAERKVYENCCVEWEQDLRSRSRGWLHNDFDLVLYGMWDERNLDPASPDSLHWVSKPPLRDFVLGDIPLARMNGLVDLLRENGSILAEIGLLFRGRAIRPNICSETKGWGRTLNLLTKWDYLCDADLVVKVRLEKRKPPGAPGTSLLTDWVAVSTSREGTITQSPGSPQDVVDQLALPVEI